MSYQKTITETIQKIVCLMKKRNELIMLYFDEHNMEVPLHKRVMYDNLFDILKNQSQIMRKPIMESNEVYLYRDLLEAVIMYHKSLGTYSRNQEELLERYSK